MTDAPSSGSLEAEIRLAEADWAAGRHGAAFDRYVGLALRRLRRAGRAAALTAADFIVLERLAGFAALFGHVERANGILEAMAGLAEAVGNVCGARYLDLHRLHLALSAGNMDMVRAVLAGLEEAWLGPLRTVSMTPAGLARWEAAIPTPGGRAADRTVLLVRLHFGLGWTQASNGRYGDALACYDRTEELAAAASAPPEARAILRPLALKRAAALLEQGDFPACHAVLARTDPADGRPDVALRIEWLERKMRLELLRGNLGSALGSGADIVRICGECGFSGALAASRLNLAHSLILINQTRSALELSQAVLAQPDLPAAMTARAWLVQALAEARVTSPVDGLPPASVIQLWRRRGRTESVPPRPLPALPPAASFLDLINDHATAFHWHLGQGETALSAAVLRHMAKLSAHSDSRLIALRLDALGTLQCYYEGRPDEAMRRGEALLPRLRAAGLVPELWQTLRLVGWCAQRSARPPEDVRAWAEEAGAGLQAMGDSLSAADRVVYLLNKWTTEEEVLGGWVDRLVEARRRMDDAPAWLRPLLSIGVKRRIRALAGRIERYRAKMAAGAGTAARRRAAAPLLARRDRAVIVCLVLPDRTVLIRLGRFLTDFSVAPVTRQALRDAVALWHRRLLDTMKGPPAVVEDGPPALPAEDAALVLARALGLTDILAGLPDRVGELSFVPDDALFGFPFAVLSTYDDAAIGKRSISVAFTAGRGGGRRRGKARHALLASVSGGAPAGGGFPAIPALANAKSEIERLAPWFSGRARSVVRLENPDLAKDGLMEALRGAELAHIVCHGVFKPDAPHLSGLILTPHGTHAELLSLAELARSDFSAMRHVTLSACWLADGHALPGLRVLSLPETLWRAGADSVLACLWPVSDRDAAAFMVRFYHHLDRYSRGEALRRTQQDCMAGDLGGTLRHPFFWAGFTLYGEAGLLV